MSLERVRQLKRRLEARKIQKGEYISLSRKEVEDLYELTIVWESSLRTADMAKKETAERKAAPQEHDAMDEDMPSTATPNGPLAAPIGTSTPQSPVPDMKQTNTDSKTVDSTAGDGKRHIAAPTGRLGNGDAQRMLAAAKADEAARKPVLTTKLPSKLAVPAPRHLSAGNQSSPFLTQPATKGTSAEGAVGSGVQTKPSSPQTQTPAASAQQRTTAGDCVSQTPTTPSPSANSSAQQTKASPPQWSDINDSVFAAKNGTSASATPTKARSQPPPLRYQGLEASRFASKNGEIVENAESAKPTSMSETPPQEPVLRALEGLPEPSNSMLTRSKPKKAPRCLSGSSRRSSPETSPSVPVQAVSWVIDHRAQPIKPIAYLLPEDPEDPEKNKVVIINKSGLVGEGPLKITPGSKTRQARKPSGVSKKVPHKMGKQSGKPTRAVTTTVQEPDENQEMPDAVDLIENSDPDGMEGVVATPSPPASPPFTPPSSPEPEDVDMSD